MGCKYCGPYSFLKKSHLWDKISHSIKPTEQQKLSSVIKMLIYEHRMEQRLSLRKLAKLSGVSKSDIHRIETGLVDPKLSTIIAIAKALKLSVEDLFTIQ